MDYRIEKRPALPVVVRKERYPGGSEFSDGHISALWADVSRDGTIPRLRGCAAADSPFGEALLGICFDNPAAGDFDYAVGAVYDGHSPVPDGLSLEEIPANTWVAFRCVGPMPEAFQETWKRIYTEFFPTSEYQPSCGMCLEVYYSDQVQRQDYTSEIWISAEKKK